MLHPFKQAVYLQLRGEDESVAKKRVQKIRKLKVKWDLDNKSKVFIRLLDKEPI